MTRIETFLSKVVVFIMFKCASALDGCYTELVKTGVEGQSNETAISTSIIKDQTSCEETCLANDRCLSAIYVVNGNVRICLLYDRINISLQQSAADTAVYFGKICITDCGPLTNGNTYIVSVTNTTEDGIATYTCITGYTIGTGSDRTSTRTCTSGSWTGTEPNCTPVDCGDLGNINNGMITYNPDTTYQSIATHICNTGYVITGTNATTYTRQCTANWIWNGDIPTCSKRGDFWDTVATYKCGNWRWYNASTIGQQTDCGVPPSPLNGQVSVADTTYEATALIFCNLGYDITGTSSSSITVTCTALGTWSQTGITCTIRDCGSLSDPQNGQVSLPEGTTYGATATYTCDPGYIIRNTVSNITKTVICSAAGLWTSTEACAIKAEPLGAACPDPATTNLSPKQLCSADYAFCLQRSTNNTQDYTCQCSTAFYDNNGNDPTGQCKPMSELAVQNITFPQITTESMRVSWAPPANKSSFISGYTVYWRPKGSSIRFSFSQVISNTYFDITYDLESGKAYDVSVESQNTVDYTDVIKITSTKKEQALKPAKPGHILKESSDLDVADNVIELTWTASTGTVDYYAVHIFEVGMQDSSIVSNDASTSHVMMLVNMNYMKSGHRYDVTITAYSQVYENLDRIESEIHREQIKTVVKVPSAPRSVECHMTTDNSVTIKWEEPTTPNGDLVQYRVDTYQYNNQTRLKSENTGDLDLNFEVTSLDSGSYYYFNVFTINELYTSSVARLTQQYCQTKARAPGTDKTGESSNKVVTVVAVVVPVVVGVVIVTIIFLICRQRSAMCLKIKNTKEKVIYINDIITQGKTIDRDTPKVKRLKVTNDSSEKDVMEWLKNIGVAKCGRFFQGYNGEDILKLSKEDLSAICGATDGIRIYNRLRTSCSTLVRDSAVETPSPIETGEYTYAGKYTNDGENTYDGEYTYAREYINVGDNTYADLDETKRDGVPYENIEIDKTHVYSFLQQ